MDHGMTTLLRRFLHALDRFNATHPWDHDAPYHWWTSHSGLVGLMPPASVPTRCPIPGSGSGSVEWSRRVSEPLPNRMHSELG
jgi:hypothetical protein